MNDIKQHIKEALGKITPGPWSWDDQSYEVYGSRKGYYITPDGTTSIIAAVWGREDGENGECIAKAPEWLKWQNERIEELEKRLEWAARIIGSGLDMGVDMSCQLRYDPRKWIQEYHERKQP